MIKGAIFDLDGVIFDSMPIWTDLGARYLKARGIKAEAGLNKILFSMSMEQGAEYLKTHYALTESADEVCQGLQKMLRDFYFYEVPSKPAAEELMKFFDSRGISMVAATSSPREHVTKALERLGLLGYLDGIFTTGELGVSKHEPDIYNLAALSMDTSPAETLVFEDSEYALITAFNAGFVAVGVFDAYGESDADNMQRHSRLYIKNLGEVIDNWAQLNK